MRISHKQRVANVASTMVNNWRQIAELHRKWLTEGLDLKEGDGMPAEKLPADELLAGLEENGKKIETLIEFVLDGKSNRINKGLSENGTTPVVPEEPAPEPALGALPAPKIPGRVRGKKTVT